VKAEQIAVSPCSNPSLGVEEALAAYAALGYHRFEVFTSWAKSAFDYRQEPESYRAIGRRHGMEFLSLHLPAIDPHRYEETLADALRAIEFAAGIGARVVLFKAADRPTYRRAAPAVLDAAERRRVTAVIQNHCGTALTTLHDVRAVMDGVGDRRLRTLLEVGHFHSASVFWRDAAAALGETIALVHIKDQIGRQSVAFGKGEIDLPGIFAHLDRQGYNGGYVVEMEVRDPEHTLRYLADALEYLKPWCEKGTAVV
jgi:sugar phosphate isomerase/epimerase